MRVQTSLNYFFNEAHRCVHAVHRYNEPIRVTTVQCAPLLSIDTAVVVLIARILAAYLH